MMPKILERFFSKKITYADAFAATYENYMASNPEAFMNQRNVLSGKTENYVNQRLRESVEGETGKLSRVFDHIEISHDILARAYKEAEAASENGSIEQHLKSVIKDAARPFLNADMTMLNDRAIAAINRVELTPTVASTHQDSGTRNTYQVLVENMKNAMPKENETDRTRLAEQAVANLFIQGIAVSYAQKLLDYLKIAHKNDNKASNAAFFAVVSPMQGYAGKLTGSSLLTPHVKAPTANDLMPALQHMDDALTDQLKACKAYQEWLRSKGIEIETLNNTIRDMQRKTDEIMTVFEMHEMGGIPVVDRMNTLLAAAPIDVTAAMAFVDSHAKMVHAIAKVTTYLNDLAISDSPHFQSLKPMIDQTLVALTDMKLNPTQYNPNQLKDALRDLPIVSLAEYHDERERLRLINPADEDIEHLTELINTKTDALLFMEKENIRPINNTTVLKERYVIQKEQHQLTELENNQDQALHSHLKSTTPRL
ncbi:MAG TPA: hypothetical protein DDY37_05640 [Legionella sp.]|nr:hypothetical protein [Legionella sp.]